MSFLATWVIMHELRSASWPSECDVDEETKEFLNSLKKPSRLKALETQLHKPSSKTIVIYLGKRVWKPAYFESSLFIIHKY